MKYPKYPAYKDSGVEWIGKIPEGWKIKDTKRLFKVVNGSTPSTSILDYWDGDIIWITPEDLSKSNKYVINSERKITSEGYKSCGTTLVPPNSLILSTRAPIGYAALTSSECCTNQGCRSLVPYDGTYSDYYYYFMISCKEILNTMGNGATFKELSKSNLESLGLLVPSLAEQKQISFFLDSTLEKIDNGLANLQKMIELLKEKRQAIITHAVTKGLDPNVPMKDSGVEWIGEIPERWEVRRLGMAATINPSKMEISNLSREVVVSFLPMEYIGNDGIVNMREEKPISQVEKGYVYFKDGDVIVAKITPCFENGKGALLNGLTSGIGFGTTELIVLRTKPPLDREFLYYITISNPFRKIGESHMHGSAGQKRVPEDFVKEFKLAIPPLSEQRKICEFVNLSINKMNFLIFKLQKATDLLGEYRTSLISAAVTGKIDLRNFKINEISESNKYHG